MNVKHTTCSHDNTPAARAKCRRDTAIRAAVKEHKPGVGKPQVTVYATAREAQEIAAMKARAAIRTKVETAARRPSGCDYCGGPSKGSLMAGYAHTTIKCPAFGSHLALLTNDELVERFVMMLASGDYDITPTHVQSFRRMKHAKRIQTIIKFLKTKGEEK